MSRDDRKPNGWGWLTTPYTSSPTRWLVVVGLVGLILALGLFGALP